VNFGPVTPEITIEECARQKAEKKFRCPSDFHSVEFDIRVFRPSPGDIRHSAQIYAYMPFRQIAPDARTLSTLVVDTSLPSLAV